MRKYEQYTKEELQNFCNESTSIRELAIKIGYKQDSGGNIKMVKEMIKELNLNCNHFTGQSHKKNLGKIRTNTEDYLTNKVKITTHKLRLRLLQEKYFEEKCNKCGGTEWLGEKIPLELHHKDGIKDNNSLENLELLCPNCHVFTDTYKTKNWKVNTEHQDEKSLE